MATFKICIFEHQKRVDDKYPISIRVYWKKQKAYIKTEFYVTDKQITKDFDLKDTYILKELNNRITLYEDLKAKKLGYNIELYSARELAEYLKKESAPGTDGTIDFVAFSEKHIQKLVDKGKKSTTKNFQIVINAMVDYCNGRRKIPITEISTKFLEGFEEYLRGEHTIKRPDIKGRLIPVKKSGLADSSIHDYFAALRTLFNAARREYNDEDKGEIRIKHYPFQKYKVREAPETSIRALTADQIRKISSISDTDLKYSRNILSRDVFMLSFCLAGTNLADLFYAAADSYNEGRFSYRRQKVVDRRKDQGFISMIVCPEIIPFFDRYKDPAGKYVFCFHNRYADHDAFQKNVNKGLKEVAKIAGIKDIELTTYFARISFATIACNDCDIPIDDIDMSLNHIEQSKKLAGIYIKKDWTKVDRTIRKVLDYLNIPPEPSSSQSAETPKSLTI